MSEPLMAISLWEPYASLWCSGVKIHETRHWATRHRGPLAVHASLQWTGAQRDLLYDDQLGPAVFASPPLVRARFAGLLRESLSRGPDSRGCIVGVVNVISCVSTHLKEPGDRLDAMCGDWTPGRFAWGATDPVLLERPVPTVGRQGFWHLPADVSDLVRSRLG